MKTLVRVSMMAVLAAPALARAAGTLTGVTASPAPAVAGSEVTITVTSTGPCAVYVDFGDKQKAAHLSLPSPVKHVYAAPGKYVIRTFAYTSGNEAPGLSRCGGFADMELVVKAAAPVIAPNRNFVPPAGASSGVSKVTNPAPSGGGATAEPSGATRTLGGKVAPTPTATPTKMVR